MYIWNYVWTHLTKLFVIFLCGGAWIILGTKYISTDYQPTTQDLGMGSALFRFLQCTTFSWEWRR